jgi:hypothetical protein
MAPFDFCSGPFRNISISAGFPLYNLTTSRGGMQQYSFRVLNGAKLSPSTTSILPNPAAAQKLALAMFADLARDIVLHLEPDSGWQVNVSDETGRVIYRVSVVAESPE